MKTAEQSLRRVEDINAKPGHVALVREPLSAHVQALVDLGLLKAARRRIGPLGIYAGEAEVRVTDAGRKLLAK